MAYELYIAEHLYRVFKKLSKRNRKQLKIIHRKVQEILKNPHHFKPLKGDLAGARRVHIDKSFVLIYEVDENNKVVRLIDYGHHDKIYK